MKKIKYIILFFIVSFIYQYANGQELFSNTNKKISFLKTNNVDTVIAYQTFNVYGTFITYKSKRDYKRNCVPRNIQMLFWVKQGQCFKQRFDDCKEYNEQKINSLFIQIVHDSLDFIINNKIQDIRYNVSSENGVERSSTQSINHPKLTIFTFFINDTIFIKKINHYELETKTIKNYNPETKSSEEYTNENYEKNQKSILKRLLDIVLSEL